MIVGEQKPLEEIWDMVKGFKKVIVFSCNTCVAVCHSGGNKEAEILGSLLRMKAKQEGINIEIKNTGIERQCEHEFYESAMDTLNWPDLILSTACGAGVQFTAEKFPTIPVFPALNTTFIGVVERPGVFTERCQGCGQCILDKTAGLCPIARCSKSLLHGPCGGSSGGKCEIDKNLVCIWDKIVKTKMEQGRLGDLLNVQPYKDWRTARDGGPRKIVREELV